MKVGIPLWYGNISSISDEIERASSLGFNYVEISLDYPWPEVLGKNEIKNIIRVSKKNKIELSFHAPPEGIEIASPWKSLRTEAVLFLKDLIIWTKQFKPLYFNFHGYCGENNFENELWLTSVLNSARKSCVELGVFGKKNKIITTFENTPDPVFGLAANVDFLLKNTNIFFCYDFGHSSIVNELSQETFERTDRKSREWGRLYKNRIKVVHLHKTRKLLDHYPFEENDSLKEDFVSLLKETTPRFLTVEVMNEKSGPVHKVSDKTLKKCLEVVRKWEALS